MKFASFIKEDAKLYGKETALELTMPFDEGEIIEKSKIFVFENMPTIKNIKYYKSSEEAAETGVKAQEREKAKPGKPVAHFY